MFMIKGVGKKKASWNSQKFPGMLMWILITQQGWHRGAAQVCTASAFLLSCTHGVCN